MLSWIDVKLYCQAEGSMKESWGEGGWRRWGGGEEDEGRGVYTSWNCLPGKQLFHFVIAQL